MNDFVEKGETVATSPAAERQGLDIATIAYVNRLVNQFVDSHTRVHDDFVQHHEREHGLAGTAHEEAKAITARRLEEVMQTVRAHYDSILEERDRRYEERFQASQTAITAAFDAREKALFAALDSKDKAVLAAFDSAEKAVQAAFDSAEKAIAKAELSIEKRADATYVTLNELGKSLAALMPRAEAEQRFAAMNTVMDDVRDRVKGLESVKQGGKEAFTNVQMFLGIIIALVIVAGYIAGTR